MSKVSPAILDTMCARLNFLNSNFLAALKILFEYSAILESFKISPISVEHVYDVDAEIPLQPVDIRWATVENLNNSRIWKIYPIFIHFFLSIL